MKKPDHSNKAKRRGGHPPFVPTDEQRHIVAVLSGLRVNWDEIRKLILNPRTGLPIPKTTLSRHFRRELDVGAVALKQLIASKYFAALDAGEAWAVRLGMRNRFGWIFEGSNALPPDVMGAVGSEPEMKISFVLPDKREMRDMAPPIDVTPQPTEPPDYSRPALPKPMARKIDTPFGPWRMDNNDKSGTGWMK